MSLDKIVEEMNGFEKSIISDLNKSIEFTILGKTLKAAAAIKKATAEAKITMFKKQIEELGGEVKHSDEDSYGMESYGNQEEANERQVRDLNWSIRSCERTIKTCERILEHIEDKKKFKLMDYEMEEYGL